jgi:xanthine dehydrogenase YagR molybdenum-binding subunit
MAQDEDEKRGVTRRGFLQGTGLSIAAATLLQTTSEALAATPAPKVVGPGAVPLALMVNGKLHKLEVEPRTTLAEALRTQLGLTGTKVVCDRGACSACTVHLDGVPVCSCLTLALEVGTRKVTTIEGLAHGETLHPVQAAFIEYDAMQCGFCTPGMIMSCAALQARNPRPSLAEVQSAVSGNLCRCGTYPKVFAAALAACGQPLPAHATVELAHETLAPPTRPEVPADEPPAWPASAQLAVVGHPTPRLDGRAKVTGAARYTADVRLPGMLYAKRVVSPHPHARVKSIDTSAAERLPGVKAVHVIERNREGAQLRNPPATVEKYPLVRYAGQTIAGVAAVSQAVADEAARLVKVEYELLPFVVDLDEARKAGAPLVYPGPTEQPPTPGGGGAPKGLPQKGNARGPAESKHGDLVAGWKQAEVTVEGTFRTQVQTHSALETHGVVADWKPDGLTVYASTQGTASVRDELAEVFGLPKAKVHILTEFMGGGFGAKFGAGTFGVLATHLSKATGAPVRLMLDRKEEHTSVGNRPSSVQTVKIGATRAGALTAFEFSSWGTAGIGCGAGVGPWAERLYPSPSFASSQYDVFTHAAPGAAFRAPGAPQSMFAVEQLIDELAEKCQLDPLALRDKLDAGDARSDREARRVERRLGAEKAGWSQRRPPASDGGPVKRGLGVAQAIWGRFVDLNSACEVRLTKDGSIEFLSSVMDIGTGTRTAVAQIVAEELGVHARDVTMRIGNTDYPIGPASGGSKTLLGITAPARTAAWRVKKQLFDVVAPSLSAKAEELDARDGKIFVRGNPGQSISFKKGAAKLRTEQISAQATRTGDYGGDLRDGYGGVQFAEVVVDTQTGVIRVERVVAVHECGRIINPLAVQSQVNGGILHGISWALYENRQLDRATGRMVNPNLDQYKIAGARETPAIEVLLVDQLQGRTATDANGIGEPANIATAAAVANAVYNAIGVRIRELPMKPAVVLAALANPGKGDRR